MSDQINKFPEAASEFAAGIKSLNRNPSTSSGSGYYIVDSLSVDFKIQGFINDNSRNIGAEGLTKAGTKFIINTDGDLPPSISNFYNDSSGDGPHFDDLSTGDVIVWNPSFILSGGDTDTPILGAWELWFDASSQGISGPSGGAFGYVVEEQQFYGYFGSELGWDTVGVGNTGETGNTGADAVVGAKYIQTASAGDVNSANEIFVANAARHTIKIHAINDTNPDSDLKNLFFPNGVGSILTNPKVLLSLYNATNRQTYTIKVALTSSAIGSSGTNNEDEITINFDASNTYSFYEVISSTSGIHADQWSGVDNTWDEDDEIYVLAISDGLAGIDGTPGLPGVTGQGITFGGNVGGELNIKYIFADGQNSSLIPTGIVDGSTGDPGEVGLLLGVTGWDASGEPPIYWGNNTVGNTGDVQSGEMFYTIVDGEKIIAIHYDAKEGPSATPYLFGFTAGDIVGFGTDYEKKKGTLYLYEETGNTLVLRSFIKYTDVRCTGTDDNSLVLIKGIRDDLVSGANNPTRLGITLEGANIGKDIYTLISPDGLKGTGITFGAVVGNTLFLDYIDENGNTFGRFASVEGVSGDPGGMNPFNIPYTLGATSGSPAEAQLTTTESGGNVETVSVHNIAGNGDDVGDYVKFPVSGENINKSGFLTVFSTTNVEDFGVFRFTGGSVSITHATYGIAGDANSLRHVGGNITQIIGTPTTGFPTGSNILFAINTDGPKGAGGSAGAGFTYGNEYFVGLRTARPLSRTDSTPLEIGDKWFCTDVGIEFTFMGVSGDGFVNQSSGGDGSDYEFVWVQTNNARQGQQGPRGNNGTGGGRGVTGATGINSFEVWSSANTYPERSGVYLTRAQCLNGAGTNQASNINANWNILNSGSGATNGFFVSKSGSIIQRPGDFTINTTLGWNAPGSRWRFAGNVSNDGHEVYLDAIIQDSVGGAEVASRIIDDDGDSVNFRGPTGPSGSLVGNDRELVFIDQTSSGITGQGTTSVVVTSSGGADRLELVNYREKTTVVNSLNLATGVLTIDCDVPVKVYNISSTATIGSIKFTNMADVGDGATVYIRSKVGGVITWNVGDGDYKIGTTSIGAVFISSQGYPTPNTVEFPTSSEDFVGAFTFKYASSVDNGILIVNFVPFVQL